MPSSLILRGNLRELSCHIALLNSDLLLAETSMALKLCFFVVALVLAPAQEVQVLALE